jgi:hypothetical protein
MSFLTQWMEMDPLIESKRLILNDPLNMLTEIGPVMCLFPSVMFVWMGFSFFIFVFAGTKDSLKSFCNECVSHFIESNEFGVDLTQLELETSLHLSLSHPFSLRYNQISSFLEKVGVLLDGIKTSQVSTGYENVICVLQYCLLVNLENTRAFIVLRVIDSSQFIQSLLNSFKELFIAFGLPLYFEVSCWYRL